MQMDAVKVEQEHNDALLSKFMDDMMPTKLFNVSPIKNKQLWVFWSQDESDEHTSTKWKIQNRIKTTLCDYYPLFLDDVLVQFWAPEMIGGRLHLTTSLQPFALTNLRNQKLNEYRKHCVGYKLVVSDEDENGHLIMDGIVCRVFRNKLPEFGSDLSDYSVSDFPQRDFALGCCIKSAVALPVFEVSGLSCIGVLELLFLTTQNPYALSLYVEAFDKALKRARLETIHTKKILSQINDVYEGHLLEEIQAALKLVCTTHDLPLAVGWVSCAHINRLDHDGISRRSYIDFRLSSHGEVLVSIPGMSFVSHDHAITSYVVASRAVPLRVRQGLVGKAFSSGNTYLCRDVRQLNISEYPLVHFAGKSQLAACFAVCLRNISTGTCEHIIELFLPGNKTHSGDIHSLCSAILATIKQQLKSFEVVTGDM